MAEVVLRLTPEEARAVKRALQHVAEQQRPYGQPYALWVNEKEADLLDGVARRIVPPGDRACRCTRVLQGGRSWIERNPACPLHGDPVPQEAGVTLTPEEAALARHLATYFLEYAVDSGIQDAVSALAARLER